MSDGTDVIGIDLGTTFTVAAFCRNGTLGNAEVIANKQGNNLTPSCVAFTAEGSRFVGDEAKEIRADSSEDESKNIIFQVKHFMGKTMTDECANSDEWPFRLSADNHNNVRFDIVFDLPEGSKTVHYTPEEVSAKILASVKEYTSDFIGREVTRAVITVPARFNEVQRAATRQAAKLANLEVLAIVNEPTAAALAYGAQMKEDDSTILVYDLGGGTFDVSIIRMNGRETTVLATEGLTNLGGNKFDRLLFNYAAEILTNKGAEVNRSKLLLRCEEARKKLSWNKVVTVNIRDQKGKKREININREVLNGKIFPHLHETIGCVESALMCAKLKKENIDYVVMVGGVTRTPLVRQMVSDYFCGRQLFHDIHPDEAVAYGAALLATQLAQAPQEPPPLPQPHPLPTLADTPPPTPPTLKLRDVSAHDIGVKLAGNAMDVLIPGSTQLPFAIRRTYYYELDRMKPVDICIPIAEETIVLQELVLPVYPRKAEDCVVEVEVSLNANAVLTVTAQDPITGINQTSTIEAGHLTPQEMKNCQDRAAAESDEDKKAKEKVSILSRMAAFSQKLREEKKAELADAVERWMESKGARATADQIATQYKIFMDMFPGREEDREVLLALAEFHQLLKSITKIALKMPKDSERREKRMKLVKENSAWLALNRESATVKAVNLRIEHIRPYSKYDRRGCWIM